MQDLRNDASPGNYYHENAISIFVIDVMQRTAYYARKIWICNIQMKQLFPLNAKKKCPIHYNKFKYQISKSENKKRFFHTAYFFYIMQTLTLMTIGACTLVRRL